MICEVDHSEYVPGETGGLELHLRGRLSSPVPGRWPVPTLVARARGVERRLAAVPGTSALQAGPEMRTFELAYPVPSDVVALAPDYALEPGAEPLPAAAAEPVVDPLDEVTAAFELALDGLQQAAGELTAVADRLPSLEQRVAAVEEAVSSAPAAGELTHLHDLLDRASEVQASLEQRARLSERERENETLRAAAAIAELTEVTARAEQAEREREEQHDSAARQRDALTARLDAVVRERDALDEERDALEDHRDVALRERDAIGTQLDATVRERDALEEQHDAALRERDAIGTQLDATVRERDALEEQRDATARERDAAAAEQARLEQEIAELQAVLRARSTVEAVPPVEVAPVIPTEPEPEPVVEEAPRPTAAPAVEPEPAAEPEPAPATLVAVTPPLEPATRPTAPATVPVPPPAPARGRLRPTIPVVMFAVGSLAVADAVLTVTWKEPISSFYAARQQSALTDDLTRLDAKLLDVSVRLPPIPSPRERMAVLARRLDREARAGDALGRLRVPRLGLSYVVVHGTGSGPLKRGPGHYSTSPLPGERGTVGIAGHRTTFGAPFRRVNELRRGDKLRMRMPYGDFEYVVEGSRIVDPSDTTVLRNVRRDRLVLTACHPLYSARERIVVIAALRRATPRGAALRIGTGSPSSARRDDAAA